MGRAELCCCSKKNFLSRATGSLGKLFRKKAYETSDSSDQVPPSAWSLGMTEFGVFGQSIQFSLIKYPDTLFRSDVVVAVGIQGRTR